MVLTGNKAKRLSLVNHATTTIHQLINSSYIGNHLSYKPRNYLCIQKTAELESAIIELINTKKSNVIISAIHKHSNMGLDVLNDIYLNLLLDNISKESKSIFLLGEFNVDLLRYDHHAPTNEFHDSLSQCQPGC